MTHSQRFVVHGRVQGVGFRVSTLRKAQQLKLSGWVRNDTQGFVEVLAYGDQTQLQALHDWLQQGPSMARVTEVEASAVEQGQLETAGFEIR